MPPKLRNQAKPENSNQPTLFQQWRFRTKPSHPSESPNVRCEKLFLQLWRTVIHWDNIAGFIKYIRYIGRPRDKNRVLFRQGNSPKVCYYIVWKHTLLLRNFWRYFHCTKTFFRLKQSVLSAPLLSLVFSRLKVSGRSFAC